MAKRKPQDQPAGSPAWMSTFSDLMNLLLCFFVLLFSMSSVDAEKFEKVAASLSASFSIFPSGGSAFLMRVFLWEVEQHSLMILVHIITIWVLIQMVNLLKR